MLVLPELCITGYTCQDLFFSILLDDALNAEGYHGHSAEPACSLRWAVR
ncbi:MAG: hypothetical protein ACLSG5_08170 [Oscillospiraceae bacterium]